MSLILHIDTATETAQVGFSKEGQPLLSLSNTSQRDHAAFLQAAIQQLVEQAKVNLTALDAIAVVAGPGSYTGLRVGMASAKGLCYALQKPLINLSTLEVLAVAARQQINDEAVAFCPMIDARRMEVFTAVYSNQLKLLHPPSALILHASSFSAVLEHQKVLFIGNGAAKWRSICQHINASFAAISITPAALAELSHKYYTQQVFSDLAYAEPVYLKEFNDLK